MGTKMPVHANDHVNKGLLYDVTNPATMTSLTLYYDVTNPATMTSLTPLL